MSTLDPEFAVPPSMREYMESGDFIATSVASVEDMIADYDRQALRKRAEIQELEREAAEAERDAANARLNLIELKKQLEQCRGGRR